LLKRLTSFKLFQQIENIKGLLYFGAALFLLSVHPTQSILNRLLVKLHPETDKNTLGGIVGRGEIVIPEAVNIVTGADPYVGHDQPTD